MFGVNLTVYLTVNLNSCKSKWYNLERIYTHFYLHVVGICTLLVSLLEKTKNLACSTSFGVIFITHRG